MDIKSNYTVLVESLRLLALSYEEQQGCLPDFVVVQDEVLGTFNDAFLLLPQIIEAGFLDNKSIASIIRCYNWMDMEFRSHDASNIEAFKNSDGWQKVRRFAEQALTDMKEAKGKPDLSHVSWVGG